MKDRARWHAFVDRIARTPRLDDAAFAALLVRRVRRGEPGAAEEAAHSPLAFVRASAPRSARSGR
jgi:hypothetical protein